MPNVTFTACPCCGHTWFTRYPAQFSEFISCRVFNGQNQHFEFLHCQQCGFSFYTYRLSDDEVGKLYFHYRDENYQRQRQQFERWYTPQINQLLAGLPEELVLHQQSIARTLVPCLPKTAQKLLDFGGDRGQRIPALPHITQTYVYDISASRPVSAAIKTLNSLEQCQQEGPFGVIMCVHVLEHINFPAQVIDEIKKLLAPEGLLYVEEPFDSPFHKKVISNLQYLVNPYFKWADLIKQFVQQQKQVGFSLHEHINFFTPQACQALLESAGFEVLTNQLQPRTSVLGKGKAIVLVARVK